MNVSWMSRSTLKLNVCLILSLWPVNSVIGRAGPSMRSAETFASGSR